MGEGRSSWALVGSSSAVYVVAGARVAIKAPKTIVCSHFSLVYSNKERRRWLVSASILDSDIRGDSLPFDCNLTLFSDNFGFPDGLAFNSSESALSGGGDGDDITLLHGTPTFDDKITTPLPPPPPGNTTLFGDDFGFQDGLALDSRESALGGGNGDIILLHGNPTFNDTIAAAAALPPRPPSPPADSILHCETKESEATVRRRREIQVENDQCAQGGQQPIQSGLNSNFLG